MSDPMIDDITITREYPTGLVKWFRPAIREHVPVLYQQWVIKTYVNGMGRPVSQRLEWRKVETGDTGELRTPAVTQGDREDEAK